MSSTQNTASTSRPRARHHQQTKGANQAQPTNNTRQPNRRQRGNRAHQGIHTAAQQHGNSLGAAGSIVPADAQDGAFSESAILSSEEVSLPTGPRYAKKHTQSQPSSDRVFSPTNMPTASLTDSEATNGNNPSATPAKAQGAYAGPTFHASPAPSALPMPKFLSRSVPAKSREAPPPSPPLEDGSDSAASPTPSPPSPSRAPIPVPSRPVDSPLDLLFKADRAERARNANFSPSSANFPYSPDQFSNGRPHHSKQNSQSSLNVMFPIELDAEGQKALQSPPSIPPATHRSVTAPSKLPQTDGPVGLNNDPAIQELLERLSMSQNKVNTFTPPKTVDRIPSEPSSRHHTPSPFHDGHSTLRSASGPTTPAPANQQDQPDFFYGNRNLSPLFKAAARPDLTKRNSGLRTEITADSPILPQGQEAFPPMNGAVQAEVNGASRRGGPYRGRPDSFPYGNNGQPPGNAATAAAAIPKVNPFVPSSVKAKQYGSSPSKSLEPSALLEQDLKRLLNLQGNDSAGVH
ncbi:hypothetical protein B0J11DRAFT_490202 [Dendryphion nanum]|uniref:Proteophosphoglycan 5 n=1 Tax=Dendryphion nanum TaxID=256645 RepID=A0A9P9DLA6_9PLEO|nr:hypothetical protein B0J11DRAFT_490202 [Dendryphion nanum]